MTYKTPTTSSQQAAALSDMSGPATPNQPSLEDAHVLVQDVKNRFGAAEPEKFETFLSILRELIAPWDGVAQDKMDETMQQRKVAVSEKLAGLLEGSPDLLERTNSFIFATHKRQHSTAAEV